jgi:hypothetical protein
MAFFKEAKKIGFFPPEEVFNRVTKIFINFGIIQEGF